MKEGSTSLPPVHCNVPSKPSSMVDLVTSQIYSSPVYVHGQDVIWFIHKFTVQNGLELKIISSQADCHELS